jgi:NhaB family Na+:H+ antiporter
LLAGHFLGGSPRWYKQLVIGLLVLNPVLYASAGPYVTGWAVVLEVILALALARVCYPLQPSGLIVIEAVALGLASPAGVSDEVVANFAVLLLLMFMVAGIHFLKDLMLAAFSRLLLGISDKRLLAAAFCGTAALLSAFLDALTVIAVIVAVVGGSLTAYERVRASGTVDGAELEAFRRFLRDLLMHAAVGTALGGACTLVGEPQNLLIGTIMDWDFREFAWRMAPIAWPTLAAGLAASALLEHLGWFGYGTRMPDGVRAALERHAADADAASTPESRYQVVAQAVVASCLVIGLVFHVAEVGLVGLAVLVLATAFTGVVEEHRLGGAFEEAKPITALIVVFFGAVAVIHEQHLFGPVIASVLGLEGQVRAAAFFLANGALSAISDNVFVATVYIREIEAAYLAGTLTRAELEQLAVAVNTGTNLPSVATPNGQAAFLFLLTSALAPRVGLGYGTMVWKALPYTFVLTAVGLAATLLNG